MQPRRGDLLSALTGAVFLAVSAVTLTQCSAGAPHSEPAVPPPAAVHDADEPESEETRDRGRPRDEHQEEETARIKAVARALKTIAADPVRRRTYGFPP